MKRCAILFLLTLSFSLCHSQDLRTRYGVFGDFNLNMHTADFKKIPDCPSCSPGYEKGTGTGFTFGALFEYPLASKFLLGLRVAYYDYSAELKSDEPMTLIVKGIPTNVLFNHSLKGTLTSIGAEPYLSWNVFDQLFVSAGMHIGSVIKSSYDQKETTTQGTFLDSLGNDTHSQTRNAFTGDFNYPAKLNLSILFGLSYELPMNQKRTLLLVPEVQYVMNTQQVIDYDKFTYNWKTNSLRFGLAIKYSPESSKVRRVIEEKIERIDTIRIESDAITEAKFQKGFGRTEQSQDLTPDVEINRTLVYRTDTIIVPKKFDLTGNISAYGLEAGKETANPVLKIEEFCSSKLQPLLNYVFFDENSSEIPSRYVQRNSKTIAGFSEDKFFQMETLPSYYEILNIIGYRMTQNPDANLKIVGTTDGVSSEKDNKELAKSRAESVKQYLVTVWNVSEDRFKIVAGHLPEKPSTPLTDVDKMPENRRVELYSDNYEILRPIFSSDTIRTSNPPVVRFKADYKSTYDISNWSIDLQQNGRNVKSLPFANSKPNNVDWKVEEEQSSIPRMPVPLVYNLNLKDAKGHTFKTENKKIDINLVTISRKRTEKIEDKEIDRYSLILFDFDRADISGNNSKIIDLIKKRIKPSSNVIISGITDRTGEDDYNLKLSEKRAQNTLKALNHPNSKAQGYGETNLIYNNDLPEGRFYCRTVNIVVETPIQ